MNNLTQWWKALLSACLFGVATPFSKELLAEAHPVLLASLFYLGAAFVLLPHSVYLQKQTPLKNLSRPDILNLFGSLFFGGMVGPVLLLFGLRYTEATNASLLLNLETPATTILAFWLFKENISRRTFLSNAGIVLAGGILTFQGTTVPGSGGILIALACMAWGLDNNHTASIHSIDPIRCTFLKGMTFGTVNLIIASQLIEQWPPFKTIVIALFIGAFSYGVSIVLYISSARGLGAARSQMVFATSPFWGVALSQLYLGESFYLYQVVSALLLIAMLVLLFTEKHTHRHTHIRMEHTHHHTHDDGHHIHEHTETVDRAHSHPHVHKEFEHTHPHWPDVHHRHEHES